MDIRPSSSNEPAADAGDLLRRLSVTFVWTAVGLIVIGGLNLLGRSWSISDLFFVRQDAPMLLGSALALSLLARLRLPRPAYIPDVFTLEIGAGPEQRPARVAWRGRDEIGIEFLEVV